MSFTAKLSSQKNDSIYLVRGGEDNTGRKAWYYIRVVDPKARAFLKAVESGNISFDDFGVILESGYGDNPPDNIKTKMKEKYGFEGGE